MNGIQRACVFLNLENSNFKKKEKKEKKKKKLSRIVSDDDEAI